MRRRTRAPSSAGHGRKTPGHRSPRVRSVTGRVLHEVVVSSARSARASTTGGRRALGFAEPLCVGPRNPVRVRGGSATVRAFQQTGGLEPDTGPRGIRHTRGENPAGGNRAHRTAVHVRHRPAERAGVRRRLRPRQPGAARPPVDGRGHRGLRPRRRPAARLAAGPLLRLHPRRRDRHARRRARWRAVAERRADGAVVGADGRRGRGPPLPRRGRPGEPPPAPRLPLRHGPADRRGVRAAGGAAAVGVREARVEC